MHLEELIKLVDIEVSRISSDETSLNVAAYVAKRLPFDFPNKGLRYYAGTTQKIQVYHELFQMDQWLSDLKSNNLECLIDFYGRKSVV